MRKSHPFRHEKCHFRGTPPRGPSLAPSGQFTLCRRRKQISIFSRLRARLRSRWRLCRLTDAAYPLRVNSARLFHTEGFPTACAPRAAFPPGARCRLGGETAPAAGGVEVSSMAIRNPGAALRPLRVLAKVKLSRCACSRRPASLRLRAQTASLRTGLVCTRRSSPSGLLATAPRFS